MSCKANRAALGYREAPTFPVRIRIPVPYFALPSSMAVAVPL